jgi:hypothetical protein
MAFIAGELLMLSCAKADKVLGVLTIPICLTVEGNYPNRPGVRKPDRWRKLGKREGGGYMQVYTGTKGSGFFLLGIGLCVF